jgi:DNA-binding transcriptional regulator GbsR (MarR family)
MTAPIHNGLCQTRRDLVEACGRLSQLLGFPRSTGQIYGLLYLSVKPLSLDDIVDLLGSSKASASNGTRQLHAWGAIRQVWVQGNRRDYFEAVVDLSALIRGSYHNILKPRVASTRRRLDDMVANLDHELEIGEITPEEHKLCAERLKDLARFQKRVHAIMPIAEKVFYREGRGERDSGMDRALP